MTTITITAWELAALNFACFGLGVVCVFAVMAAIPEDWFDDDDNNNGKAA